jgi:hypothetical protein
MWARSFTLLTALMLSPALQAQSQAPSKPEAATANPVNSITPIALQQGAISCVGRVNQLSNFLGFGPQAGAVLMTPASQPDQHILPIAMEVPLEGTVAYIAATFAPNQANGCGAVYDAVVYWKQGCDVVASKQFAALKRVGQMKADIAVLDGGPATKVFLMPAGSGCVSIKKEVAL